MPSVMRDVRMAWLAFAVAALGVVASILLLLLFAMEVPYNGPYLFGAGYEVLTAVANVLTVALVMNLSRRAGPSGGGRVLAPVLSVMLVVAAGSAILLVTHVIGYVVSVTISIVVLLLQGVWMIWLNGRMANEHTFPRSVSTFGWLIGAGLVIGLPVAALSLILPPLTLIQLLVLGFGVFLAGGALLVYSFWWVMVGVWLMRGGGAAKGGTRPNARGTSNGSITARRTVTPAPVKSRGRRKA